LTQLYGLRYGCVPIVARTGGLADTVIDANDAAVAAGVATGFLFSPLDHGNLVEAVLDAARLHRDPRRWAGLQKQGMKSDLGWSRGARRYAELFTTLAKAAR
ncbi:MAG: starch synthase, partial [Rhizobiaceae bacterium]